MYVSKLSLVYKECQVSKRQMPATVERTTDILPSSSFGYGDGHGESAPPINKSGHGRVPWAPVAHRPRCIP